MDRVGTRQVFRVVPTQTIPSTPPKAQNDGDARQLLKEASELYQTVSDNPAFSGFAAVKLSVPSSPTPSCVSWHALVRQVRR